MHLSMFLWIHDPLYEEEKHVYDENLWGLQHYYHLLSYAAKHWYLHAESCWSEAVETMVLSFLSQERKYHWKYRPFRSDAFVSWHDNFVLGPRYSNAMHLASYFGTINIASALLKAGHDPQAEDSDGVTPLSYAVINEQQVLVEWLLNLEGTDPDHVDMFGNFPLLYAVPGLSCLSDDRLHLCRLPSIQNDAILKQLLQRNDILINAKGIYGMSALARASEIGAEGAVALLLERNDIEVNSYDRSGSTPLLRAIDANFPGSGRVVELLLEKTDTDVNCRTSTNFTPLMLAAYYANTRIVELLLARDDIEINYSDSEGRTALTLALSQAKIDVVELLLARDDIKVKSIALLEAAAEGCTHIVGLLLAQENIEANFRDSRDRTALMWAAKIGSTDIVKLLFAQDNIELNCRDEKYRTALMIASFYGKTNVVKMLLAQDNVELNCRNDQDWTALMLAADDGWTDVVKLLLARKDVEVNCRNDNELTALDLAYMQRAKSVVDLLEQSGAQGSIPEPDLRNYSWGGSTSLERRLREMNSNGNYDSASSGEDSGGTTSVSCS